jgi:hypothetical protein
MVRFSLVTEVVPSEHSIHHWYDPFGIGEEGVIVVEAPLTTLGSVPYVVVVPDVVSFSQRVQLRVGLLAWVAMNMKSGSLFFVDKPLLGDCRMIVIDPAEANLHRGEATLRGMDDVTNNMEMMISIPARVFFMIFSPPPHKIARERSQLTPVKYYHYFVYKINIYQ